MESAEAELDRFRERERALGNRICEYQLELSRLQIALRSTQRLLDARNRQSAEQQEQAATGYRVLEERVTTITADRESVAAELDSAHSELLTLKDRCAAAEAEIARLSTSLSQANEKVTALAAELTNSTQEVLSLRSSLSWRLTGPARKLLKMLRGY